MYKIYSSTKFFVVTLFSIVCGITANAQTYQFTGNGNWTVAGNWTNNTVPPSPLAAGDTIIISPAAGDSCVLNITQSVSPGAIFIVITGARFIIPDGLFINANPPVVATLPVTEVSSCSAMFTLQIVSTGSTPITASGFVWSTSPHPVLGGNNYISGGLQGTGIWETRIAGFTGQTLYYVRAYATNSSGTSYGQELSFTTNPFFPLVMVNQQVTNITDSSASVSASIHVDACNFGSIYDKGFVVDTLPRVMFDAAHTIHAGPGAAPFTSQLTNLLPGKTYYVTGFCTTMDGMTYFGTSTNFITTNGVSDSISVVLCSKRWMRFNLDAVTYRNGDTIPQITDSAQWASARTGAWCYYNNDPATEAVYGKLYNWFAVNDPRGLAPAGWHVATDNEWRTMSQCIDPATNMSCTECMFVSITAGNALRDTLSTHWVNTTGATNSSGFSAVGAGGRKSTGAFWGFKEATEWWTATIGNPSYAYAYGLNCNESFANLLLQYSDVRMTGKSVRCVKD